MEIRPAAPLLFCPVVEASAKKAVECVKPPSQWMIFLLQRNQLGNNNKKWYSASVGTLRCVLLVLSRVLCRVVFRVCPE